MSKIQIPEGKKEVLLYPKYVWADNEEGRKIYSLFEEYSKKKKPGDKTYSSAGAPGFGHVINVITRIDDDGIYGYEEENTMEMGEPEDFYGLGTRFGKIPSIRVSLASAPRALSTLQGDNFFKDKIQNVGSDVFVSNDKARLYEFYQTLLQMNEEVIEQNIADDEGMLEEDDDMKGKGDMYGKGTRLKKHLSPQEYSLIRGTPNAKLYVYDSNAHLYNLYDEKIDKKKLERFMANFPDDAKSWAQATDEMRDLARRTREAYNELVIDVVEGDPGYVEGLDFRSFKSPSEWNTKSKAFIREMWVKLTPYAKQNVIEWIDDINEVNPTMRGKGDRINSKLPAPRVMDKLAEIAKKHLFIDTLETRSSDRLDFHEVSVWGVKDALVDAYYAGSYQLGGAPMKGAGAKIDGLNGYYLNKGQIILELDPTTSATLYRYEIQSFKYCYDCSATPDYFAVVKEFTLTEGKPTPEFNISLRDLQNRVHNGTYKLEGKVYENHRDRMLLQAESELIMKDLHCDGCAERDEKIVELKQKVHKLKIYGGSKVAYLENEVKRLTNENTKLAAQFENQKRGHDDTLAGVGALMHGAGGKVKWGKRWFKVTAKFKTESGRTKNNGFSIGIDKEKTTVHKNITSKWIKDMERQEGLSYIPDSLKVEPTDPPFGDGTRIPNNYDGKTAADVWDAWSEQQRLHFMSDHKLLIKNLDSYRDMISKTKWNALTEEDLRTIRPALEEHVAQGQYGRGKRIHIKKIEDQIIKDSHEISKKYPFRENETTFLNAAHNFEQSAVTKLHEAFMNDGQNEVDAERLAIERVNELRSKMYGSGAKMKGGGESIGVDVNVVATDDFSEIKKSAKKHGGKFISAQSGAPGMKMLSFNFNKREDAEKFKSHIEGEFYKIEDIDISEMKGGGALIAGVALGFLTNRLYDYYKDHKVEQKVDNTLKGSGTPVAGKGAMFLSSEQYAKIRKTKKANKYEWDADKQLYRQKGYSSSSGAKVRKPRATSHWNVETKDGKRVTVISSTRPMKNWTRTTIDADGGKSVVIAKTLGRA